MSEQTVHTQFWRLPSSIRHKYNERELRRVDIIGAGTKQVVLMLLADGHTDRWSFKHYSETNGIGVPVGWVKGE